MPASSQNQHKFPVGNAVLSVSKLTQTSVGNAVLSVPKNSEFVMRNAEFRIGSAYDRLYFIKVGATTCGRPKNDNQSHARRVGRGLAPAEKSHCFRGGLWASRPTFVSMRKLRISFPILRHGLRRATSFAKGG